jgi:hypothetical protein
VLALHDLLQQPEGTPEADEAVEAVLFAATITAWLAWRDAEVRRRWPSPAHVQASIAAAAPAALGLPPIPRPGLSVLCPRGPRPGPRNLTPEEFLELEPAARAALREMFGREPSSVAVAAELGISLRTYARYRRNKFRHA